VRLLPLEFEGVFPKDAKAADGSYRTRGVISRPFIQDAPHAAIVLSQAGLESCAESALQFFAKRTRSFAPTAES
jgi:hypothetical protein